MLARLTTTARFWPTLRFAVMATLVAGCFNTAGLDDLGGCQPNQLCSATPVQVAGGHQFTSLSAGRYHTCGRKANGEVWCWGINSELQLGAVTEGVGSGAPLKVGGSVGFKSVNAGEAHTCAVGNDDGAYCWGNNSTSVLGDAPTSETCEDNPCSSTPLRAAGTLTFMQLDAGAAHNCALDFLGAAKCWGTNFVGELGSSSYLTESASPVTVPGGLTFTRISAGFRFNCALDSVGALYCWGIDNTSQLAGAQGTNCATEAGSFRCSAMPLAASTTARFSSISVGGAFGCGITTTGTMLCWGSNEQGQLGSGSFEESDDPVAVQGAQTWTSVTTGYFHACALRSNGAAFCWGVNNTAQLGDGSKVFSVSSPQPVGGGRTFTQIVAGANHTCGLATDGTAWCWGSDDAYQLGRG